MNRRLNLLYWVSVSAVALLCLGTVSASMAAGMLAPPQGKKAAPPPPALGQQSGMGPAQCFGYRAKGGDAWQIGCYPDVNACVGAMERQKSPAVETLGCAPAVYCFTYNAGGKSSACYLDGAQCANARAGMAKNGNDAGLSLCVANSRAGSPVIQMAQAATLPPPPPPTPQAQGGPQQPVARQLFITWTPTGLREFYNYEDAPQRSGGCLDASSRPLYLNGVLPTDYRWVIEGIMQDTGARFKTEEHGPRVCRELAEGAYIVTLTESFASGAAYTDTLPVVVKDVLIAGLGDSFSSGEGNPDTPIIYNTKSALPFPYVVETKLAAYNYGSPIWADSEKQPGNNWSSDNFGVVRAQANSVFRKTWKEHRLHSRCHRSKAAATPLLARAIASQYKHLSVTMMHMSCSGATINEGVAGSYAGVEVPTPTPGFPNLWPQIDDMNAHVGARKIDAVTLSIGGNDVGFADVVAKLSGYTNPDPQSDTDPSGVIQKSRASISTLGDGYRKVKDSMESKPAFGKAKIFVTEYPDLVSITQKTNGAIGYSPATMKDVFTDAVFWNTTGAIGAATEMYLTPVFLVGGSAVTVAEVANVAPSFDGLTQNEAAWGHNVLLPSLNAKINEIVGGYRNCIRITHTGYETCQNRNWVYVGGIAGDFYGHGYCSLKDANCDPSKSWVRTAYDSVHLQGPPSVFDTPAGFTSLSGFDCFPCKAATKGIMHPTELGHRAIANRLYQQVSANLFSNAAVSIAGPQQANADAELNYTVSVVNSGPSEARDVVAAWILPPGYTVTGCRDAQSGQCNIDPSASSNRIAIIEKNQKHDFVLTIHLQNRQSICGGSEPYTIRAVVSSFSPDTDPTNNAAVFVTTVTTRAARAGCVNEAFTQQAPGNAPSAQGGTFKLPALLKQ